MRHFFLLIIPALLFLASCGAKSVSLLDREGVKLNAHQASLTTAPSAVRIHNENRNAGFGIYHSVADWTPYKALRWTAENHSAESMPLYVRVYNDGNNQPGLFKRYVLEPGSRQTLTLELPEPMPYPEIYKEFPFIRNSPYGRISGLYADNLDYAHVEKVTFFNGRGYPDAEWTVSDVELVPGKKARRDKLFSMTPDEFFPFIDKYGQFKYAEWPGKVHEDADLQKAREAEEKDLAAHPGPKGRSKYGGWAAGPKLEATGHFRVEKIDGKWWMVDPEGYLFWSHGVVRVSHSCAVTPLEGKNLKNRCHYFEELPAEGSEFAPFYRTYDALLKPYYTARGIDSTYDFSSANLYRKYGKDYLASFGDICHRRLRSWGLNTIANSSDKDICLMDRTPYMDRLEVVSEPIAGTTGWWPFMDPFDPSFTASVEKQLTDRRREVEDPWCLGFFVDNEIKWGHETYLAEVVLKAPATQAAKKQFLADLKVKYGTIAGLNDAWGSSFASWDALLQNRKNVGTTEKNRADLLAFNHAVIHKYFSNIRQAFDKLAPGVLYMGCRFAGYTEDLISIGARYCDVISFNRYGFTVNPINLPESVDKPVMVGEYHFGALDRGMFHSGLIDVGSQERRAEAYVHYVESALHHPNVIGVHWHQFSDQATTGRFDGENLQVGFTDVCDTPYPETIAGIRKVGYGMYECRKNN
ncbi:MAG: beta-galactosidase [Bacteroidales bacterium]|nr:beta-galactosidase [Bacteroidales bacterium]